MIFEIQGPYRIPTMRKNNAPPFGVIHNPVHPTGKNVFANNGGHNLIVFKDIELGGAECGRAGGDVDECAARRKSR